MFSRKIVENLRNSSFIRAMFEEGEKLRKLYGADKVYDFSLGNPDSEPPKAAKEALKRLVLESAPGMHGYMSNAGYQDVRGKVAEFLTKKTGVELTSEHIIMTCGAGAALNVVLKAILNPGEEVIVFAPYFVEYGFYIDNSGGKIVTIPTNTSDFQPDPASLEKAINANTKAVIINTPNNPTGVVYSEDTLKKLSEVISAKEKEFGTAIFLVSDEPYREIVFDNVEAPSTLKLFKNSIMVYSFSKSLSFPGERIGYIAVSSNIEDAGLLIAALAFCNRTLGFVNAPALFQKVIGESLDATVDVQVYKERRDMLYNHLTALGFDCVKPDGAFYLFPRSPIADDVAFIKSATKYNLLIVPGSGFKCPGHFRIAYCKSIETIKNSLPAFEALAKEYGMVK